MTMPNLNKIEPHQILFPLGVMHALLGASVWILFVFQRNNYPGILHANQMIGGFLFSFVAGFLLTAIPRFIGTKSCSTSELMIAGSFSFLSFFSEQRIFILLLLIYLIIFF